MVSNGEWALYPIIISRLKGKQLIKTEKMENKKLKTKKKHNWNEGANKEGATGAACKVPR